MAQPKLSITKKATITVDARTAKPVDITVPDAAAKAGAVSPTYTVGTADGWQGFGWELDSYANFRTAHAGPQVTDGTLYQDWVGLWAKPAEEYDMIVGGKVKQLATGYTKHYKASELAAVKTGLGASSSGCTARLRLAGIRTSPRAIRRPSSSSRRSTASCRSWTAADRPHHMLLTGAVRGALIRSCL